MSICICWMVWTRFQMETLDAQPKPLIFKMILDYFPNILLMPIISNVHVILKLHESIWKFCNINKWMGSMPIPFFGENVPFTKFKMESRICHSTLVYIVHCFVSYAHNICPRIVPQGLRFVWVHQTKI